MRLLSLLVCLCLIIDAWPADGILKGRVANSDGSALASAKVTVTQDGKQVVSAVTASDGSFKVALPKGQYLVTVQTSAKSVLIESSTTTSAEITVNANAKSFEFFDQPSFTVAGVTDNTYRGGHGSDTALRSSEALTHSAASLADHSIGDTTADFHHARAQALERSGNYVESAQEFQKAVQSTASERNIFDWGIELLSHHAPQAAEAVFSRGHELYPKSERMMLGLVTSWYAAGLYEKAAGCFFEAIRFDPNNEVAYTFLYRAQALQAREIAGYNEQFSRFVKLQPNNALANFYRGVSIWKQEHDADVASGYLKKAVILDTHLASAYLQLGIIQAEQSQYAEAETTLLAAVREQPDLEEAHYRLADVFRNLGKRAEAEKHLAIYKELQQKSVKKTENERREVRQFVIALEGAPH